MTEKRFEEVYGEMGLFRVKDNKTGKYYKAVLCGNPFTETDKPILDVLNEIADENEQLKQFKERVFLLIDKRIRTLEANSKQCHQGGSHEKGIEFTLQAELLERLKMELVE